MIKKEYTLEGLDCANCASQIETALQKLTEISDVSVNFMNRKLIFYVKTDKNYDKTFELVKKTIDGVEDGITISPLKTSKDTSSEDEFKKEFHTKLAVLIFSLTLFFLTFIIDFSRPVEIILLLISYMFVGLPVVMESIRNISKGRVFDENFLMTIATIGAFGIGEFAEGVAVMLFYQVGELFQSYAVNNSRKSISALMDIRPDFANVLVDNQVRTVSPEEVNIDDIILIKPGEKIPLDGVVVSGDSSLDTSALTGESKYTDVTVDDTVLSGSININGVLNVKVTKPFAESTVSKILDLVENASSKKSNAENFITKFAQYYTPVVVVTALLIATIPPLLGIAPFVECLNRALVFLVISCPCALVISIPLGYFSGIGSSSKNGILVKGSNYLEALNDVDTVIFDKTGTLTEGGFSVSEIVPANDYTESELLEYATYAESLSNHPIAVSLKKSYNKEVDSNRLSNYEEIAGHGISVQYDNYSLLVGNYKLMDVKNIDYPPIDAIGTIIHVAINNAYAGYIIVKDTIKSTSAKAISALHEIGITKTVMLTGDNKYVAEDVANTLGIDEFYSELLPADKFSILESIESKKTNQKGKIAFVGDGINDAPVIVRADVGIAMGGVGSDVAIESADIVLMNDDPYSIVTAIKIAKKTQKIVIQNIVFALAVKAIILILGLFGIATMWEAVFADVGVSMIAILNSMRIQFGKQEQ